MKRNLRIGFGWSALALLLVSMAAVAEDEVKVGDEGYFVPLSKDKPYIHVIHEGRSIKVQRVQDPDYELRGYFAKTARKCPPFCIQPIVPDPDVKVIGELELFEFMENELRDGRGILVDARTPSWFEKGTIPGSVNYPFTMLSKPVDSPEMDQVLEKFGALKRNEGNIFTRLTEEWGLVDATHKTEKWDFTGAKDLVIWCNGPACGQSPRAIQGLRAAGYPADKIHYYRGGMQMWQMWGLTTVTPK